MHKNAKGGRGEDLACEYLLKNNYKIIGRNVYFRASEIDIIAAKNSTLIFVEVKARAGSALPAEAVTTTKRQKLFTAMHQYLAKHPAKNYQLDVIAINFLANGEVKLEHYENIGMQD